MSMGLAVWAYMNQYCTPGVAFHVTVTLPFPGVTVMPPTGGGAELPLPPQLDTSNNKTTQETRRQVGMKFIGVGSKIRQDPPLWGQERKGCHQRKRHPKMPCCFETLGRRDWTRTNDPHHVKVVL